jgi:hypothetical protein
MYENSECENTNEMRLEDNVQFYYTQKMAAGLIGI